ncbi:MAG: hypothetical protein WB919_14495, partial [Candidatus Sulfotelmatobacter sp.]
GIEEEVRLKLHLKSAQVGAGKLLLQFERAHGVALGSQLGVHGRATEPDKPVDEQLHAEPREAEEIQSAILGSGCCRPHSGDPMYGCLEHAKVKHNDSKGDDALDAKSCEGNPQS